MSTGNSTSRVCTAAVVRGPASRTSPHVRREFTQWASIARARVDAFYKRSWLWVRSPTSRALNATRALNPAEPTSNAGFAYAAPSRRRIDRTSSRFSVFQRLGKLQRESGLQLSYAPGIPKTTPGDRVKARAEPCQASPAEIRCEGGGLSGGRLLGAQADSRPGTGAEQA